MGFEVNFGGLHAQFASDIDGDLWMFSGDLSDCGKLRWTAILIGTLRSRRAIAPSNTDVLAGADGRMRTPYGGGEVRAVEAWMVDAWGEELVGIEIAPDGVPAITIKHPRAR